MQDKTETVKPVLKKRHRRKFQINSNAAAYQDSETLNGMDVENVQNAQVDLQQLDNLEESMEQPDAEDEDNELDSNESEEDVDYDAVAMYVSQNAATTISTTTTTTTTIRENISKSKHSLHCIGEGLSGHITRWSALPAPSCRGKWLRLSLDAPKKCTNSQFIFV